MGGSFIIVVSLCGTDFTMVYVTARPGQKKGGVHALEGGATMNIKSAAEWTAQWTEGCIHRGRERVQPRVQGGFAPLSPRVECLRISSRTVFETEYDVISNLFRIQKLCLRFLIYVMLENFRIDNQHGLCAEKC